MRVIRPAIRLTAALIVLLGLGLLLLTCFVMVVHIIDDGKPFIYAPEPVMLERIGVPGIIAPITIEAPVELVSWAAVLLVAGLGAFGAMLIAAGGIVYLIATRRRQRPQNPAEDEQSMRELYQRAMRMEERMEALETLLLQQSRHEEWSARP